MCKSVFWQTCETVASQRTENVERKHFKAGGGFDEINRILLDKMGANRSAYSCTKMVCLSKRPGGNSVKRL